MSAASISPLLRLAGTTMLLAGMAPGALGQEEVYIWRSKTIDVVDPVTMQVKRSMNMVQKPNPWGMTHDGARLLAVDIIHNGFQNADTIALHPATGDQQLLGTTGLPWNLSGLEYDPTTGKTYAAYGDELFLMDPVTGGMTYLGFVTGLKAFEHLCALAINQSGEAYALGYIDNTLYQLDLVSLIATPRGVVQLGQGFFEDAAFDHAGLLWGSWSPTAPPRSGVYTIDVQTLAVTLAFPYQSSSALAIGPATPETPYCTGKTNSLGCDPMLESSGLASVTGVFGYEVRVANVGNNTLGRLLFTTLGASSTPFAGGTLCVASPWNGTPVVKSGGSPKPAQDCTGSWTYDLNAYFTANPGPGAGDTVYCQWIGRDRGFAPPDNYALSSALQFTLLP